jgi:hypothetical protein
MKTKEFKQKENKKGLVTVLATEDLQDFIRFAANPWKAFFFNFLKGTGYGLGLVLGTAIILTIVIYILNYFIDYPIIGEWLKRVGEYISLKK